MNNVLETEVYFFGSELLGYFRDEGYLSESPRPVISAHNFQFVFVMHANSYMATGDIRERSTTKRLR